MLYIISEISTLVSFFLKLECSRFHCEKRKKSHLHVKIATIRIYIHILEQWEYFLINSKFPVIPHHPILIQKLIFVPLNLLCFVNVVKLKFARLLQSIIVINAIIYMKPWNPSKSANLVFQTTKCIFSKFINIFCEF